MRKDVEHKIIIGNRLSRNVHLILSRITGFNGCFSIFSTLNFIKSLKKIKPDIIHLHNLHNCYINLPILFRYIKKNNIRVIWTLHDCWSFTGQCPHFVMAKCDKWKTRCHDCPSYKEYPSAYVDRTKTMWKLKKKWFTGVKDMTVVTPSQWMADLVKESFLKEYPIKVINNGINLAVFKPTKSNFRKKYGCEDKKILLGVSFSWGRKKGLDVFVELSKRLSKEYQIVLVGTDDNVDAQLPDGIISIHKTANQTELAEIYTAADLFLNPTREENYPTVNMEAIACGTPVLTFRTGGSPEILGEKCGEIVECNDIDAFESSIKHICCEASYKNEFLPRYATKFDMNSCFEKYLSLYKCN